MQRYYCLLCTETPKCCKWADIQRYYCLLCTETPKCCKWANIQRYYCLLCTETPKCCKWANIQRYYCLLCTETPKCCKWADIQRYLIFYFISYIPHDIYVVHFLGGLIFHSTLCMCWLRIFNTKRVHNNYLD